MGTSSSNPGPKGGPQLLPPWAPPVGNGDDEQAADPSDAGPGENAPEDGAGAEPAQLNYPTPDGSRALYTGQATWNSVRRLTGSMASGRASGQHALDNVKRGVQRSVGAMGGRRAAAQSAVAGRQTAGRFASFLAGVAAGGIAAAARTLGIAQYLGRSADVFLVHLADALAPAGALNEDAVARKAMDATLLDLYRELGIDVEGLVALERITPAMMASALVQFVINYIHERVINALAAHLHESAPTITRIGEVERTALRYIEGVVRQDLDTTPFFGTDGAALAAGWDVGAGQRVINRLIEEAYAVVEAGLARPARGVA